MALLVAWVAFPLVLCGLAIGCGLLLERVVDRRLPGGLLFPSGFAVVLVAASLTTMSRATASLTVPLAVALAVAGAGLRLRGRRHLDRGATAAALGVFAVYAAPIVLSGAATFAGYISLDDTATWLAIADNALSRGRSLAGLAPSSYSVVLTDDFGSGYPIAAMLPLGIGHELVGEDAAWLFQPYLAFLALLLSQCLYAVVAPLVRAGPARALVAFVGAQPALLYGYAFWSGIKELTVAYLLALMSGLALVAAASPWRARAVVPLAVAAGALLVSASLLGTVWLAGLALVSLLLVSAHGSRRAATSIGVFVACGLVFAIPALASARRFVGVASGSEVGHGSLGNLVHPLSTLQLLGVWPTGDFRLRPAHMGVTVFLLAVVALSAVFAVLVGGRHRAWGLPLYTAVAVGGSALVLLLDRAGHGSAWLDAKALASASPAPVAAGMSGAALLFERGRHTLAVAAVLAIAGGVLWSNELAYGSVWLAPRDQLAELEAIGARFAGDGPALMTEYQPYGVRHFLRALDPEGASERRARPVTLRDGGVLGKAQYADLDAFDLDSVLVYRTLVLRTSPLESRPPSSYVPVWIGRYYEVWERVDGAPRILQHLSLGRGLEPAAVPACAEVMRLAREAAGVGGALVTAVRPDAQVLDLAQTRRPESWSAGGDGGIVPRTSGHLEGIFTVPVAGRFGFWLGGSFRDRVRLRVDGAPVGSARAQLESTGQAAPLGTAHLRAGAHIVELAYDGGGARPGSRGAPFLLGPLEIGVPATAARLARVPPADAATLCGRRFDWIEAAAP
jgi:hypothetical protein